MAMGAVLGCDSSDSSGGQGAVEDSFQDNDLPMGGCDGTGCGDTDSAGPATTAAGAPVGDPCDGAKQCQSGFCAAVTHKLEIGALVCQPSCIGPMDETMWCSDSATCCDGAVCSSRGYCVMEPAPDEGTDTGDASESTSTTADASTSTSG